MDSDTQIFKAQRRHKFIMWTVVALCALFSLCNILAAASGGRIGQMFSEYMDNHESFALLVKSTGLYGFFADTGTAVSSTGKEMLVSMGIGQLIMIGISLVLIYLAIAKGFEPLLLIPIGFGGLLSNAPGAGVAEVLDGVTGFLMYIYNIGIAPPSIFPLIIFMGVGAMTDFGPMIANPKVALLGGAAQFGIFATVLGALVLTDMGLVDFSLKQAASIGIIGGADGPTAIFLTGRLAPELMGAIVVAAYSYMALVPIIQPPIMRALTTVEERKIKMEQLREVSRKEKIIFVFLVVLSCVLFVPSAAPLMGMLMFGNLLKESKVVDRLAKTAANDLCNIVTIFIGLTVGSKLSADKFLAKETLGILILGLFAFSIATAAGVLMAKLMNCFSKEKLNPLIGAAGVSAVPMAARVADRVAKEVDPTNFILMHAMGPNVSGVIGSAVAAGILLVMCS